MPKKNNNNKRRRRPAPLQNEKRKNMKDVASSLANTLGKGIIPIVVASVAKLATKMIPAPLSGPNGPVTLPASVGNAVKTGQPRTKTVGNGNMNIVHREFVNDISIEQVGFQLQYQFGINPGNSGLFPWLSTVARRFEMYKFRSLRIIYEPQTGTTSSGTIMLAIDYDASDLPPLDKTQMMSYKNAVRSPQWSGCVHQSASADLHRLKTNYVLSGVAPPNSDIKTFDIGNLFVAVQSSGEIQASGELYVEYDVDLITPQIDNIVISGSTVGTPYTSIPIDIDTVQHQPFGANPPLYGSLPFVIAVEPDSTYQKLWIQQAGFWLISAIGSNVCPLANDGSFLTGENLATIISSSTVEQTEVGAGGDEYAIWSQIRVVKVIDPSIPQFFLGNENGADLGEPAKTAMLITPIGQDCLLNQAFNAPYVGSVIDPRARLGRTRR